MKAFRTQSFHLSVRILFILSLCCGSSASNAALQTNRDSRSKPVWVYFRDKGSHPAKQAQRLARPETMGISQRALTRRAKVRPSNRLVDASDLPVHQAYVDSLQSMGFHIRSTSRWLNAASVLLPENQIPHVRALSFVRSVHPVARWREDPMPGTSKNLAKPGHAQRTHNLDYGDSEIQNSLIHVPEVHDLGLTGEGVLVGMIDTGFDFRDRPVFEQLHVMAEHDFHWDDDTTANQDGDAMTQHNHGTTVLSIIGGFREGELIGPAYGASFALAKTEWVRESDLKVEEEHWIEAIEWLESLGADVVSSSLGYGTFVDAEDYSAEELDGNTAAITIAADIAAGKGVVVVNSAGNRDIYGTKINFPADGDSVIAVGAVDANGDLYSRSSMGPTADGRIKPDVVAMGQSVTALNPARDVEAYWTVTGTSASCPLVAGACALILQAHPDWGPMQVREALRQTADRATNPDNAFGWGLVDALRAVTYKSMSFDNLSVITLLDQQSEWIGIDIASQTGIADGSVALHIRMNGGDPFQVFPMSSLDDIRFSADVPLLAGELEVSFYIEAMDTLGVRHYGPLGAPTVLYQRESVIPEQPQIKNYPNPFNVQTTISFTIKERSAVKLSVYDLLGREVCILVNDILEPGVKQCNWDGRNASGKNLASGIYFLFFQQGNSTYCRKMILTR